jgi:hypothetical protein
VDALALLPGGHEDYFQELAKVLRVGPPEMAARYCER